MPPPPPLHLAYLTLPKNYARKLCCDQNSKINLIKKEIISTGAVISGSVIIA